MDQYQTCYPASATVLLSQSATLILIIQYDRSNHWLHILCADTDTAIMKASCETRQREACLTWLAGEYSFTMEKRKHFYCWSSVEIRQECISHYSVSSSQSQVEKTTVKKTCCQGLLVQVCLRHVNSLMIWPCCSATAFIKDVAWD